MNQISLKTLKNTWIKSLSVLDNPYVNLTLIIVLILYSSKIFGNINEVINELYKYTFIKLLVLLIIVYVAHKDTNIAILLGISYVISLKNNNMERFISSLLNVPDTTTKIAENTCNSVKFLQKALDIYTTINSGLTDIIKSITDLKDPDLYNITNTLTILNNNKLNIIITNLKNTITRQSNGINCIINKPKVVITSLSDTLNTILTNANNNTDPTIFCNINNPTTANDNILLSLALIADNIKLYNSGTDKALSLTTTCMSIQNSISNIITNIKESLIGTNGSISDSNAKEIISALNDANTGIIANIKYADGLLNQYLSNILKILCSIVTDNTYKRLIQNLSNECKNNVATQLLNLIKPDLSKFNVLTQTQKDSFTSSINSSVLIKITKNNILNPTADWLTECNKSASGDASKSASGDVSKSASGDASKSTSGDASKSVSSNEPTSIKTNNNIYYNGIIQVMNILNKKQNQEQLNDFGQGLNIAYDKLPSVKNSSATLQSYIKDIMNRQITPFAKAYGIGILAGNFYNYNNIKITKSNNITTLQQYKNTLSKTNNLIQGIILILAKELINLSSDARNEAIGFAVGYVALGYINFNSALNFKDRSTITFIAQNAKTVTSRVLNYFKNSTNITDDTNINKISSLAEVYVSGILISNIIPLANTGVSNISEKINELTNLDQAKIYSNGLIEAFNIDKKSQILNKIHDLLRF